MKKIVSLFLACALGMSLVACGGGEAKKPAESKAPAASAEKKEDTKKDEGKKDEAKPAEGKKLKAGVFYYDFADAYIATVREEMDKMLKELGVEFTNYDAAGSQPTQTDSVSTALAAGANILIVNVVETSSPDAAQEICDKAKNAKVPVIFFNREVADSVIKSYDNAAYVGTNAPEAGHLEGEMIGDYLVKNYDKVDLNKDGKISYVLFKGQEGNNEAEARTKYSVEDADKILEKAGKPALVYYDPKATTKYLVDKDGKWSSAAANDYMTTLLGSYSEANKNMVELVIANNDEMALGALSALQNAGYNKEGGKYIPIFGVDATATAQEKIKAGEMMGSVKQDNVGMAKTITYLVKNIMEGKKLMDGADKQFKVDQGIAKIRVPYQKFTGK